VFSLPRVVAQAAEIFSEAMMISNEEDFDFLRQVLASGKPVENGMRALLDYSAAKHSVHVPRSIYELPYQSETGEIANWLGNVLKQEPPAESICAFYFGIFYVDNQRNDRPCLYISGSEDFSVNEKESNWACQPEYFPKGRYALSSIIEELDSQFREMNDVLSLGYAGLAVWNAMSNLSKDLTLGTRSRRDMAVGFDAGDVHLLPALVC
jgi:hypothetical protein